MITVIAAGGCGSRMCADRPKSLMRVCGRTLLEHTLDTVSTNSTVVVYNNQRAWDTEITNIVGRFPGARLAQDAGVQSTIELAVHAAQRTNRSRLCFLYGHAPRPVEHLRRLGAGPEAAVAATLVIRSSKVHPIAGESGFLEPPYLLPVGLLQESGDSSWANFLARFDGRMLQVFASGPSEANWPAEMRVYRRYVRSRCLRHRLQNCTDRPRQLSARLESR